VPWISVNWWNLKYSKIKRFADNFEGNSKGTEQEKDETDKKDPRGPKCYECSSFGHIQADYRNFKQAKGKALNAPLSVMILMKKRLQIRILSC
jgi:hypothetical protein